jgi:hypothetical protein
MKSISSFIDRIQNLSANERVLIAAVIGSIITIIAFIVPDEWFFSKENLEWIMQHATPYYIMIWVIANFTFGFAIVYIIRGLIRLKTLLFDQ